MTLETAQTIVLILGAVGGLGWMGNTALGIFRGRSQNKVDDATAASISTDALARTVKALNEQLEANDKRHKQEIQDLRTEFDGRITDLRKTLVSQLEDVELKLKAAISDLEDERRRTDKLTRQNHSLRQRIMALEAHMKANKLDPDDIPPHPI